MDYDNGYWEEENELEEFCCVLGDKCMMPSPFHFPSECHTAEDYEAQLNEDVTENECLNRQLETATDLIRKIVLNLPQSEIEMARAVWGNTNTRIIGEALSDADKWLASVGR